MPIPASAVGREGSRTVVRLRGEHDVSTVTELSEAMARAIGIDEADIVVDMSEVEFMGAAAVGVIVRAEAFLRDRSRALSVRTPSRAAQRVLDVCGLTALIDSELAERAPLAGRASALATWVAVPSTTPPHPVPGSVVPEHEVVPLSAVLGRVDAPRPA